MMARTRTFDPFRFYVFPVIFVSLTLFALSVSGCSGGRSSGAASAPDLGACQNLQAPAGNRAAFRVFAKGVQVYRWNGTSWVFQGPEATLFRDAGERGVVGSHYAGPTWESPGGSRVVGAVLDRCTRSQDTIPWLLLKAGSTAGRGIFEGVTYIQRVDTSGGNAPTAPGDAPDAVAKVPYTAEYYFYRASNGGRAAE